MADNLQLSVAQMDVDWGGDSMQIAIVSQDREVRWRRHMELYGSDKQHLQQIKHILEKNNIPVSTWDSVRAYLDSRETRDVTDELVFSLIENCFERNSPGLLHSLWELLGIAYIGSDAYGLTLTADKILFQNICCGLGLKCPQGFEVTACDTDFDIQKKAIKSQLPFPIVLKYRYGTMSYGVTIAEDLATLTAEAKRLALAEEESSVVCQEYIPGMEAAVPIVGTGHSARALALVQYTAPDRSPLRLYDRKWKTDLDDLVELVSFPHDDPLTQRTLQDCLRLYRHLKLRDMCRIDLRITETGDVYFLEANCIPSLGYEGAFDPISYGGEGSFEEIILEIVRSAYLHYRKEPGRCLT